jgi:formylglycine-generating enzyme required for sulfatase activity
MKLFMSYRRKSWPFTHRLADELAKRLDAELFVDFTGVNETDFEKSILGNLRTSDAVLLVISDQTFVDRIHKDDDWVRREIREALMLNLPIVLVCVEGQLPPSGLPDDIKDVARMQGINFYPDYFLAGVDKLADFVVKIGVAQLKTTTSPISQPDSNSIPEKTISGKATLDEALELLDYGDFNKAIFLLESLRDSGFKSRFIDLSDLFNHAHQQHEQAEYRRAAELEYEEISILAARKVTEVQARKAFDTWCNSYSDLVEALDTQNLRERFKPTAPPATVPKTVTPVPPKPKLQRVEDLLPTSFAWCQVTAGKATIENKTFDVAAFSIAKYPVTNDQYAVFLNDGYGDEHLWRYSKEAQNWRKQNPEPQATAFAGKDLPRTNVCWYDAVAFCQWLSAKTGEKITLPTEQQWQRAAQGDDGRTYPWGNDWDGKRCNNSVNPYDSSTTTPVTQYDGEGDSPFKVVDMAGNVWEWCVTDYESGEQNISKTATRRVLRGGSWAFLDPLFFRAVFRYWDYPVSRLVNFGFRIARD